MRSFILASAAAFGVALAGPAMAQQAPHPAPAGHWHGSSGGQWRWSGGQWHWQGGGWQAHRNWGGSVGGRWIGGSRAPGGWSAYRPPVKGWAMPGYWLAPSFAITDWGAYGLSEPPYGYHWSRYYDDAVLVDQYGRVMDSVGGIDWDGYDDGYADRGDYDYDTSHDVGPGAPYPPPPPPPGARVETRTYGYGYGYGAPPPPPMVVQQGPGCGCYGTIVNGWYYPPATTTTVTITSVPVTTTTTEVIEEEAPVVHHVVRKWRPKPKRHWTPKLAPKHKARCLC